MSGNQPYNYVNRQQDNNDTVWNGMGIGASVGLGAAGLAYGATKFGNEGALQLDQKLANMRMQRIENKNSIRESKGKSHLDADVVQQKMKKIETGMDTRGAMYGGVRKAGNTMFGAGKWGTGKRAMVTGGVGLMGGLLTGGIMDDMN